MKKFIKQDSLDFYYIPYNEDVRKFDCLKNYISLIPERELSLIKEDISALLK